MALPNDKDEDYYAELLYRELDVTASQSSSTNIHSDDEIIDLAVHADQSLSISPGYVQKHKNISVISQQNSDLQFKKCRAIESLVTITNILEQIKATLKFVTETQRNMAVDKLNELYRIEQAIIIEESNDNLYNNLSKLSLINKLLNVNQVNYFLLRLSDDLDEEESNMSNKVIHYLALPKKIQECNILE
ncbi:9883_t:CDS:2 [Cetraspora pellucida]|uniref:9883_t:CDS:1 n=1 Tax=Cetraspora pellucida TaxID=1433469 RepID=A0ACA9LR67_9GLOM|nr:9883_t:CDS:2 [Cetraspora pellucida]